MPMIIYDFKNDSAFVMRRLELAKLVEIDPRDLALEVDDKSVEQLRSAIKNLTDILITIEAIKSGGGMSPNSRFLIVGSSAFDKLEVGLKGCVVHCIDELRLRRKG